MRVADEQELVPLYPLVYADLVRAALAEDLGIGGDLTSAVAIPAGSIGSAHIVAREEGVLAGIDLARAAFAALDPAAHVEVLVGDGGALAPRTPIARIVCDARALLAAERTALNLLSHLSGIATATARFVAAVRGTNCRIAETRKTLPGLRALQKYAVRAGGGSNHRFRLDDAILFKDNHVALAGGISALLASARAGVGHLVSIEIEVDSLAQLDEVLASPVRVSCVLLDNFPLADIREAITRIGERELTIEVSGGVTLESAAAIAATGVDVISVGSLTHSVRALDLGLDIAP